MVLNDVYFACKVWFCYRVLGNFAVHFMVSQFQAHQASVKLVIVLDLIGHLGEDAY
jgi:hypothetical protein